jgi:hypothetical protein
MSWHLDMMDQVFQDYSPSQVNRIFLTLHGRFKEAMKICGGNGYNVPHIRKCVGTTRESPAATQLWSIIGARGDDQIKWMKCSCNLIVTRKRAKRSSEKIVTRWENWDLKLKVWASLPPFFEFVFCSNYEFYGKSAFSFQFSIAPFLVHVDL